MINGLRGSVRLEVSGAFPERFLNLCAQNGMAFWDVEWLEATRLRLTLTRAGGRAAPELAGRVLCELSRVKTGGVPFFLARFRKRYALLVGLCLSLTAVLVLSRFILIIDVEGNETVPTAQILSELRRQGLRVGVYGPGLDERDLAHEALLQLPDLSWMAINLHGTRAQVLVREAVKKPPAEDGSVVGDVVAESGGIVSHMEVLSGEAVCQEGDTVAAGDVLISGSVKLPGPKYGGGVDLGWSQVRAAGRIYARTWRTLTAQIPLEAQVKQYTGSEETCWSLTFLGVRTVFSRNSGISFPEYDKISRAWTAALPSGRELPLTLKCETVREYVTVPAPIDRAAAQALLEERLELALRAALGVGEAVSTAFSAAERDGMLRVTLQAECREEIGRFVPAQGLPETAAQESQPEV